MKIALPGSNRTTPDSAGQPVAGIQQPDADAEGAAAGIENLIDHAHRRLVDAADWLFRIDQTFAQSKTGDFRALFRIGNLDGKNMQKPGLRPPA